MSFTLSKPKSNYSRLIDYIDLPNQCRILEIGFSNAVNLDELYSRGANVYGIDKNPLCLENASSKDYANHLRVGTAFDIPALFSPAQFDFIIMNSILHKIYSRTGNFEDVQRMLSLASKSLFHEGMLLFDEGLKTENDLQVVRLSLSKKWNRKAKYYFDNQPFGVDYDMEYLHWGRWKGTLKSVTALLHVLKRSEDDFKKETLQFNQLASLEGFKKMLEPFGFDVDMFPYTDPVLVQANGSQYTIKDLEDNLMSCPPMSALFKATLVR